MVRGYLGPSILGNETLWRERQAAAYLEDLLGCGMPMEQPLPQRQCDEASSSRKGLVELEAAARIVDGLVVGEKRQLTGGERQEGVVARNQGKNID